jgi:chromodomain-helicase-DNA-binding protein 1
MLGWLVETMQVLGPFLIVVPLSTVPIWFRELAKWVPSLNTVLYVGNQYSREIVRNYELFQGGVKGSQKRVRFDVLVTTYEVFLKDASLLQSIRWV